MPLARCPVRRPWKCYCHHEKPGWQRFGSRFQNRTCNVTRVPACRFVLLKEGETRRYALQLVDLSKLRNNIDNRAARAMAHEDAVAIWPDHFPEQCPPLAARRDNIQVFRLVNQTPPTAEDFLPTDKEWPHRSFPKEALCAACGVSVFRNVEDVIKKMARYPALRHKKIARGQIKESDGLVLETFQPSHMTWWLQTSTPHLSFSEYDEHGSV